MIRVLLCLLWFTASAFSQPSPVSSAFKIGRVKYSGGGDWYNDPSAEINLLRFVQEQTGIVTDPEYHPVDLASEALFSYPFLFLTGHGSINLTETERRNLRRYLENGGFMFADDDYGLDGSFRKTMKQVLPDRPLVELPLTYGLYNSHFHFPDGPPKIHEHNGKAPQGFGIFVGDRLAVLYTYESNPGDGWVDPDVHGDPEEKRQEALRFGCNVVVWALMN